MAFQIVFRTAGFAKAYVSTTGGSPFVVTSAAKIAFLNTTATNPIVLTSGKQSAFFQTTSSWPIVKTSGAAVTFVVTPDPNAPKELVLKIGTLEITGDYTIVNVPDATGTYESTTNPGGYNVLPNPFNQYRPYRDNVSLWTVYRIWDVYGNQTQTPSAQAQAHDDPYTYPLSFPTTENAAGEDVVIKGIYEIILIAAPYFNENNSGGTYLSESPTEETAYIVKGTDTTFSLLTTDDYLYYVDASGELTYMNQVLKVFSETTLALSATASNTPASETTPKLYGSATPISGIFYSSGSIAGVETGLYIPVSGSGTTFASTFSSDEYVYYVDITTGDYVLMGQVFQVVTDTLFNLYNQTGNVPTGGEGLFSYGSELSVVNSNGTYDNTIGSNIYGAGENCQFTLFSPGQTLYYQDGVTGLLEIIGTIDSIISDAELVLTGLPSGTPVAGNRLFASDNASITLISSGGTFDGVGAEATYYTLTGTETDFTNFDVDDYVYVISAEGVFTYFGQIARVQGDEAINFYSIEDVVVISGELVAATPTQLSLIDLVGTFSEYSEPGYYNVEGSGTTFLTAFLPEQYLFYFDSTKNEYVLMGQIFQVYDDTNVWLYEAPAGNVSVGDDLFSSDSLITQTADYNEYIGNTNLYDIAKELPTWYVTSVGIMVDDDVVNCLTRMRYEFLQQVMCGKCPDEYLTAYATYVGMLNAMEIQDWPTAIDFYNRLKTQCSEDMNSSCGC